jgi:hypothetical protein
LKKRRPERLRTADCDKIIYEITVDTNGEDEQLWAFRQAFEDYVAVPCAGSVLGQTITVSKFDYHGNERRGLTATCHRSDGREYVVAVSDVMLAQDTQDLAAQVPLKASDWTFGRSAESNNQSHDRMPSQSLHQQSLFRLPA